MPTIAFVKKFRKEFEDHLDGKPLPYAISAGTRSWLAGVRREERDNEWLT